MDWLIIEQTFLYILIIEVIRKCSIIVGKLKQCI